MRTIPPRSLQRPSAPNLSLPLGICRESTTTVGAHRGASSGAGWIPSKRDLIHQLRRAPRAGLHCLALRTASPTSSSSMPMRRFRRLVRGSEARRRHRLRAFAPSSPTPAAPTSTRGLRPLCRFSCSARWFFIGAVPIVRPRVDLVRVYLAHAAYLCASGSAPFKLRPRATHIWVPIFVLSRQELVAEEEKPGSAKD